MRSTRRRFLGATLGLPAALACASPAVTRVMSQSAAEAHGINPADMDFTVDPREDFYRYANGGWLDSVTIPSDRGSFGVFAQLNELTTSQQLQLLGDLASRADLEEGSDGWKAVQMFAQGSDVATRNDQDVTPIQPTLDAIRAIDDQVALHRFFQGAARRGVFHLYGLGVAADLQDSSVNTLYLNGPTFGLPNRDYYLEDTETNVAAREAYVAACTELLSYIGYAQSPAQDASQSVYEFERALVSETLTREEQQDVSLQYNPRTIAELGELYSPMDWPAYLEELGLSEAEQVIVSELDYMRALDGIVRQTPLQVIKDYLLLRILWNFSNNLSEEIEAIAFSLDQVLAGVAEPRPLEERVLNQVNGLMPDAVGQLYVAAYFPPEAKGRITELVDSIIAAFDSRLEQNQWMTSATKSKAREKLGKLRVKVGYPDEWKTYEAVEIADSYAQSALSAGNAQMQRNLDKYGKPVDKSEWQAPAQLVNAFYSPVYNDITFPAGILQPPFFDYRADPASNLGAIGFVIGHEITHGFDQGGSQFDGDGNLVNWWTEEDLAAFQQLNQQVVEQFSAIEVLPGVFVDGQITVRENVADLGGVQTAHDALALYLAENGSSLDAVVDGPLTEVTATPAASPVASPVTDIATPIASPAVATPVASPVVVREVEELTQGQRFYVAAASVWREKTRDEALATQVQTDTHSPARVRATQPLRNMDEFHERYDIQQGDGMYFAPDQRIVIW